jgi:TRAP-type C4-dicarboxylate transport system permease large subunit
VIREILPYILVLVLTVVVLVLVPPLATWLPSVAG